MAGGTLIIAARGTKKARVPKLHKFKTVFRAKRGIGRGIKGLGFNQVNPFPPIMYTKQTYSDLDTYTTGAGGILGVEQIFSMNDMFDPDFTGVGHQPYGRDQMALLYNRYKVTKITVNVIFSDPSADGLFVVIMQSPPSQSVTLTGKNLGDASEKPNTIIKYLNDSGSQIVNMGKQTYPMYKLAQVTPLQYKANLEDFAALTGVSPAKRPFLRIAIGSVRGTAGTTCLGMVRLIYHVQWYDRVSLGQS